MRRDQAAAHLARQVAQGRISRAQAIIKLCDAHGYAWAQAAALIPPGKDKPRERS